MYLNEGWINDNGWVKLEDFMTKAMLYCQIFVTVIVQGTVKQWNNFHLEAPFTGQIRIQTAVSFVSASDNGKAGWYIECKRLSEIINEWRFIPSYLKSLDEVSNWFYQAVLTLSRSFQEAISKPFVVLTWLWRQPIYQFRFFNLSRCFFLFFKANIFNKWILNRFPYCNKVAH